MAGGAKSFQVKLSGDWKDYQGDEDKILKRAYLAGFPNAKYSLRGNNYMVSFKEMRQTNTGSGKSREIRPPYKWKAPTVPIVAAGRTFTVKVPPGGPGNIIHVPHPDQKNYKGQMVAVNVPGSARVGQAMLVPVPQGAAAPISIVEPSAAEAAHVAAMPEGEAKKKAKAGWSTGAKVAAGTVVVGGVAVGGAVLGLSDDGLDATMEELGDIAAGAKEAVVDGAATAGEGITDAAEPAGEWASDAAADASDFIMELF